MSILTINNSAKPSLPTKTYCYSGRWPCEDSVHDCPGKCGYIIYKDKNGNIIEESGFCTADTNIRIVASEIIEVMGLNTKNCNFTPSPSYDISTNASCVDNGWENGATGGSMTCQGYNNIAMSDLLGHSSGFIRFQSINNTNEIGLTKDNGSPLNIGEVLPISQILSATLYAQCSNVYPCSPSISNGTYVVQYSSDGINNWYNFNLNVI